MTRAVHTVRPTRPTAPAVPRARRTPARPSRIPLSVLDLLPAGTPGPLPGSTVWADAVRDPRHPGVASGDSAVVAARRAGRLGLPFAVDHRGTTRSVCAAVAAYRAAFVPARAGGRPRVLVVADVVVAPTVPAARALAAVGGDRFVGSPEGVVAGLDVLAAATGADELLVTSTAVPDADGRRGHALLAAAWSV